MTTLTTLKTPELKFVGTVELRATTKTGFRNNRCIGQVPCKRWFAFDVDGNPVSPEWMSFNRGFTRRQDAAKEVAAAAIRALTLADGGSK